MKNARFRFNRSRFIYSRKNKKSFDELSVIFLSQFPIHYGVGFQLEIWHPQIRQIKESFMREIISRESNLCSIILTTKDFPSNEAEQENVNDYPVQDYRDLFLAGDRLAQTLQFEVVPLCDRLNTIELMDNYFDAKPDWSLHTCSGGNICTDLIVAGLNRKRDLYTRFQELMQGIQLGINSRQIHPDSRQLLMLCYESIK